MKEYLRLLTAAALLSPAYLAAQQPESIGRPGSNPVAMRMAPPQGQTGPVTGKPFSATEARHTEHDLGNGNRIEQSETSSFARDEFGRMRTGNDKTVVIFDPVGGFTYTLDVPSKTYYKTPLSGQETSYSIAVAGNRVSTTSVSISGDQAARIAAPRTSAGVEEEIPAQMVNGTLARGSRITTTIPAGSIGNNRDLKVVTERWYSDDMQLLLKSTNSDPRFGSTTYELKDLAQGRPDPALFQVPADYRLRENHWKE
jgi:hypothetical protein